MKNAEMTICACGTILLTDLTDLTEGKEFAVICGRCGRIHIIGGDHYDDGINKGMALYKRNEDEYLHERETEIDFSKYARVIYDKGIRVPMMNGEYADHYSDGCGFVNFTRMLSYQLNDELYRKKGDYNAVITEWNEKGNKVDYNRLIRENKSEELEIISHYYIDGLTELKSKLRTAKAKPTK